MILKPASVLRNSSFDSMLNEWLARQIGPDADPPLSAVRDFWERMMKRQLVGHSHLVAQGADGLLERMLRMAELLPTSTSIADKFTVISTDGAIYQLTGQETAPQPEDVIFVFRGSNSPVIIRRYGACYQFIGPCESASNQSNPDLEESFFSAFEARTLALV